MGENCWVTDEEGCFVIAPPGSTQRWVVHQPVDFYGDGYIHNMFVEVSDDGIGQEFGVGEQLRQLAAAADHFLRP